MTDAALDVDDLTVSLGDVAALDGVSCAVARGEVVGLLGPNGAGKTTLLRAASGAVPVDRGRVRVDGADVHALSSKAASRRVAVVPQETALSFGFTVREVVEMGRHPHRSRFGAASDVDRVDAAMERADVASLADRPVTAVSGGERRRVLLARALAQDADVLLLDEPTASLDVGREVRVFELVSALAAEGRAVLAGVHDLDLAARYCDRVVVLVDGRVHAAGPPESVLTAGTLRSAFDAAAAVTTDPVTGTSRVVALPGAAERESADVAEAGCRVHVLGGRARVGPHVARLARAGLDVSAGPVPAAGVDADVAAALDCEAVTAPTFAALPDDALDATRDRVAAAAVTVVPRETLVRGPAAVVDAASLADALVVVDAESAGDRSGDERPVPRLGTDRFRPGDVTTTDAAGLVDAVVRRLDVRPAAAGPDPATQG